MPSITRIRPGTSDERRQGWVDRWRRIELWAGLVLVAVGFIAVAVGWIQASSTLDVRVQLQALTSGGLGGLAFVLTGTALIHASISSAGFRRLEERLERVADAMLDIAIIEEHRNRLEAPATPTQDTVLASHASYHRPDCDLASEHDNLRSMTRAEAEVEQLRPCGLCFAERAVS